MDVKVKIYNGVKYNKDSEKVAEVEYKNIQSFEVVFGERATEIGLETEDRKSTRLNSSHP